MHWRSSCTADGSSTGLAELGNIISTTIAKADTAGNELAEPAAAVDAAWIWLEQLCAAHGKTGDFYDGKRQAGQYFFRYELPKTGAQLDLLESLDHTTLEMRDNWF